MLESLNVDCFYEICSWLQLKDEIVLWQVCERFQQLLHDKWLAKYANISFNFKTFNLSDADFRIFIAETCTTAEQVSLKALSTGKFEILTMFKFPATQSLTFSHENPAYLKDAHIVKLQDKFPNLRTFCPRGQFTGKHIEYWSKVQHLTVAYCWKFDFSNLPKILYKMKLQTLHLDVMFCKIQSVRTSTRRFPQLRKLTINSLELKWLCGSKFPWHRLINELAITDMFHNADIYYFFYLLDHYKKQYVYEMTLSNWVGLDLYPSDCTSPFKYLSKLTFYRGQNMMDYLNENLGNIPTLRELNFYECRIIEDREFVRFLTECKNIILLRIEKCFISSPKIELNVKEIIKKRTKPLHLNFYKNIRKCACEIALEMSTVFDATMVAFVKDVCVNAQIKAAKKKKQHSCNRNAQFHCQEDSEDSDNWEETEENTDFDEVQLILLGGCHRLFHLISERSTKNLKKTLPLRVVIGGEPSKSST